MKTVNLTLAGVNNKTRPYVLINGELVSGKKNKFGSYEVVYQTEKDDATIEVFKFFELNSKLWWLYAIISFFLSIFGFFNPMYDRKCIDIECKYIVKLKEENKIVIRLYALAKEGKASEIETNLEFYEVKNNFIVNKTALKRRRWYQAIKFVSLVALVICIVLLTINR